MSNVVEWGGATRLDIPAEKVLRKALEKGLTDVVITGYTNEGEEYFASSMADGADCLWLLERCKRALLTCRTDGG